MLSANELSRNQPDPIAIAKELAAAFGANASELDREGRFSKENYVQAHDAGYMRLTLPKRYGGWGADVYTLCLTQEILAQGCAGTALAICMHLCGQAVLANILSSEQQDAVFGDAVASRVTFAGGGTEEGSGGSWDKVQSRAERTEEGFLLNGRKRFASGCLAATHFFTFLASGQSPDLEFFSPVSAFLVPSDSKGVRIDETWDSMGMRASGSNDIVFENCFVSTSSLVGGEGRGFSLASKYLYWFLFGETATYLGVAKSALDAASDYIRSRHHTHKGTSLAPTSDHQVVIGKMTAKFEGARAFVHQEALRFSGQEGAKNLYAGKSSGRAAMAKYLATETAIEITNDAMQILGGFGYLKKGSMERHYRDVRGGPFHPPRNVPLALRLAGRYTLGMDL